MSPGKRQSLKTAAESTLLSFLVGSCICTEMKTKVFVAHFMLK